MNTVPTLNPSLQAIDTSSNQTALRPSQYLFLGFTKPSISLLRSQISCSYLRFLCLWCIIEGQQASGFSEILIIEPFEDNISKALLGLDDLPQCSLDFCKPFLALERSTDTKSLALRIVVDFYKHIAQLRETSGRGVRQFSVIEQYVLPLLNQSSGIEDRDFVNAKLSAEGISIAMKFAKVDSTGQMDGDLESQIRRWILRLRMATHDHNVRSLLDSYAVRD